MKRTKFKTDSKTSIKARTMILDDPSDESNDVQARDVMKIWSEHLRRGNSLINPIIGIDLSLNGTGIACNKDQGIPGLVQDGYLFREIVPKSKERIPRWIIIRQAIRDICKTWQHNSSLLVLIEGYSFGARGRAVVSLAEIGGIIRMDLNDQGVKFIEIPPTALKKFVTGKGNSNKDIILKEVYRRWDMNLDSHNLADAFGLVKLGEAILGYDKFTKEQMKVVEQFK